jgi:hypothetical protein
MHNNTTFSDSHTTKIFQLLQYNPLLYLHTHTLSLILSRAHTHERAKNTLFCTVHQQHHTHTHTLPLSISLSLSFFFFQFLPLSPPLFTSLSNTHFSLPHSLSHCLSLYPSIPLSDSYTHSLSLWHKETQCSVSQLHMPAICPAK